MIQYYTKAGGAYVVARDNFGPKIAQIAAVALLIDYTWTVAVRTSAGAAALTSQCSPWPPPSTRGDHRRGGPPAAQATYPACGSAGKFFAFPMYFYVFSLGIVVIAGYIKEALERSTTFPSRPRTRSSGAVGTPGQGWLMGLAFITLLRSFANGGIAHRPGGHLQRGGQLRRPERCTPARPWWS